MISTAKSFLLPADKPRDTIPGRCEQKPDPSPLALRVFPMNLRLGDVLADEIAEWRVIGHPYTGRTTDGPTR